VTRTMAAPWALLLVMASAALPSPAETYTVVDLHRGLSPKGNSHPHAISGLGQVLLESNGDAYLYDGRQSRDLGRALGLYGMSADGINDAGQIVGFFRPVDNGTGILDSPHAFLYDAGGLHDLGTLNGADSRAIGINALGHVVGTWFKPEYQLFLFRDGIMRDLGTVKGYPLRAARINDLDHVAVTSYGDSI
jgi:probable HAF family extracellular repeat protein